MFVAKGNAIAAASKKEEDKPKGGINPDKLAMFIAKGNAIAAAGKKEDTTEEKPNLLAGLFAPKKDDNEEKPNILAGLLGGAK